MDDYISRADAMGAVQDHFNANGFKGYDDGQKMMDRIKALPSADADGEDLIIKGAKGIQDGLYNIKDGKLFKYKGKGGTVRTYPIVPSADAVSREFYEDAVKANIGLVIENRQLKEQIESADAVQGEWILHDGYYCSNCNHKLQTTGIPQYCPMCGARMKGGDDE